MLMSSPHNQESKHLKKKKMGLNLPHLPLKAPDPISLTDGKHRNPMGQLSYDVNEKVLKQSMPPVTHIDPFGSRMGGSVHNGLALPKSKKHLKHTADTAGTLNLSSIKEKNREKVSHTVQ